MKCRGWAFRTFATLIALWLPLVAGGAGLLPPCPVHSGAGSMAAAHATADMAGMHAHADSHAMHGHGTSSDDQGSAPGHEHHGCSCIACCTMTVAADLAGGAPAIDAPVAIKRAAASIPARLLVVAAPAEYSRPYNTGPPRA
jgi:hypothetical protein